MKLLRRRSRACCVLGVAAHRALNEKDIRRTACVALTVMCILSKNKTRARLIIKAEEDPRDVKRATGAYNQLSDGGRWPPYTIRTAVVIT
eukprot:1751086-Prymnesium_polylepis.2